MFGAPISHDDHATASLAAARGLRARLGRGLPQVGVCIGVSAGPVVSGNVGAARRFEYTVIGDPVNEAARLCDLSKGRREASVLRGRARAIRLAAPAAAGGPQADPNSQPTLP